MALSPGVVPNYRIALPHYWSGLVDKSPREARKLNGFGSHINDHESKANTQVSGNTGSQTSRFNALRAKYPDLPQYDIQTLLYKEDQARRTDAERETARLSTILARRSERHQQRLEQQATPAVAVDVDGRPRTISADTRQWMREQCPGELAKMETLLSRAKANEREARVARARELDGFDARATKWKTRSAAREEAVKRAKAEQRSEQRERWQKHEARLVKVAESADAKATEHHTSVETALQEREEAARERLSARALERKASTGLKNDVVSEKVAVRERLLAAEEFRKDIEFRDRQARRERAYEAHRERVSPKAPSKPGVPHGTVVSESHAGGAAASGGTDPDTPQNAALPRESTAHVGEGSAMPATAEHAQTSSASRVEIAASRRRSQHEAKQKKEVERQVRHEAAFEAYCEELAQERRERHAAAMEKEQKATARVDEREAQAEVLRKGVKDKTTSKLATAAKRRDQHLENVSTALHNRAEAEAFMHRQRHAAEERRQAMATAQAERDLLAKRNRSVSPPQVTVDSGSRTPHAAWHTYASIDSPSNRPGTNESNRPSTSSKPQQPAGSKPHSPPRLDPAIRAELVAQQQAEDRQERADKRKARAQHAEEVRARATERKRSPLPNDVVQQDQDARAARELHGLLRGLTCYESQSRSNICDAERTKRNDITRAFREDRTMIALEDRRRAVERCRSVSPHGQRRGVVAGSPRQPQPPTAPAGAAGGRTARRVPSTAAGTVDHSAGSSPRGVDTDEKAVPVPPPRTRKAAHDDAARERRLQMKEADDEKQKAAAELRQEALDSRTSTAKACSRTAENIPSRLEVFEAAEAKSSSVKERLAQADLRREQHIAEQRRVLTARTQVKDARIASSLRAKSEWTAASDARSDVRRVRHANRFQLVQQPAETARPTSSSWSL